MRTLVEKLEDVSGTKLKMWVVSTGTADYGASFVVRRHAVMCDASDRDGEFLVEKACTVHETLDDARRSLPRDIVRVSPMMQDDPVVVEIWL